MIKDMPKIYFNGGCRLPWQKNYTPGYLAKVAIDWSKEKIRGTLLVRDTGKKAVCWFTFEDLDVGLEFHG